MGLKRDVCERFRPINLRFARRGKGRRSSAEALVAAAATRDAPPVAGRPARTAATPSIASSIVRPSLWAPPTTWTRTSGLSATKAAARTGSSPRQAARRATSAASAATESAATVFSTATATPTGSHASG